MGETLQFNSFYTVEKKIRTTFAHNQRNIIFALPFKPLEWGKNQMLSFMQHYETVFILNPVLSAEQVRETVDKFKGFIEAKGGKISHTENWGLRKLAYPIDKKKSGFYELIQFELPGEHVGILEVEMKRDERLMRFLTVALDKFALEYADRRRQKVSKA